MPWFITAINKGNFNSKFLEDRLSSTRTFGFFDKYFDAHKAIAENRGNMQEGFYDYLVLEYIEEGIHPMPKVEEWFKWMPKYFTDDHVWYSCDKPKEFNGIINFAIG